jgi:rhodanese-related sulfurtransferase
MFAGWMALLLGMAAPADARRDEVPLSFITTEELSARIRASNASRPSFAVVDARSRVEYEEAHIPGAISIPASKIAAVLPKRIKDRSHGLIFYCNGPKCTKSQKAARAAISLGYRNVLEYNEGMPGWGKAGLPIVGTALPQVDVPAIAAGDLAEALMSGRHFFLLDVRDADEFDNAHLKGAVNIPLDELRARAKEIPRTSDVVITCHVGQQSITGARLLHHLGFRILHRLDGGIVAWRQKGLSVEEPGAGAPL